MLSTEGKGSRESTPFTIVAAVALLTLIVFAPGSVVAQQFGFELRNDEGIVSGSLPITNEPYCSGNRCPGQTCDEINRRCVGDV